MEEIYAKGFDEYLHFPIIHQQAYYRLKALLSSPLSPHRNISSTFTSNLVKHKKYFKLANACTKYLLAHISKNHTLASIANALGTNRNSLAVAFKTTHNIGVFTWLRKQRLLQARHLLCSSDQHIQSIAYELGFSDPSNFTNAYKLEFGLSPSETRQLLIIPQQETSEE